MSQLYKKIGFLIVFMIMSGGVSGQNFAPAVPNPEWTQTLPYPKICASTTASNNFIFPTGSVVGPIVVGTCGFNTSKPMSQTTTYCIFFEYSIYPTGNPTGIFIPFPQGCYYVTSNLHQASEDCGGGLFNSNARKRSRESVTIPQTNLSLPYSAFTTFSGDKKMTIRARVYAPTPYYSNSINRSLTGEYDIFPPQPIVNNITKTESCFGGATGTISFDATAYSNAKVYLTNDMLPTPPYIIPAGCNPLSSVYPFCGSAAAIASNTLAFPTGLDNTLNVSNSGIRIYRNLAPRTYYLTIVNIVSEPYFCTNVLVLNVPITVDATPIMQGIVPINNIITRTDRTAYDDAINNNPNPYIKAVYVPPPSSENQLFIENIRRAAGCNTTGDISIRGTGGVAPFTLEVERTYATTANPTQTQTITPPILSFTTGAGHTPTTPRYNWTGTLFDLAYGEYRITVTDNCGQSFINIFTIKENIELIALDPTVTNNLTINGTPASTTNAFVVKNPTCIDASGTATGKATISLGVLQNIASYQIGATRPNGLRDANAPGAIYWTLNKTSGISMTSFNYKHSSGSPLNALNVGNAASFGNASFGDPVFSGRLGYEQCVINFSNLSLGDYSFTVGVYGMKAGTCVVNGEIPSITYTFTIIAPLPLNLVRTGAGEEADVTAITCRAAPDGTIRIKGTGNTAGYAYTLLRKDALGNYVPTSILGAATSGSFWMFSSLTAGSYKISIKRGNDANCADEYLTQPIEITTPPAFVFTNVVKLNISCNGFIADGSIGATIAGGTIGTGYQYRLYGLTNFPSPGDYQTFGGVLPIPNTTNSFTISGLGVTSGTRTYKVEIIDGAGCNTFLTQDNGSGGTTDEFIVSDPPALAFTSVIVTEVRCLGTIATIVPTVIGGTPPYRFYYTTAANPTTEVLFTGLTSLLPATYSIFVKDSRDCRLDYAPTMTLSFAAVSMPLSIGLANVPLFSGFAISCRGGRNGSIMLIPQGGAFTTPNEYTYKLDNNPAILSSVSPFVFAGLGAGTYVVRVTDRYGCEVTQNFTLTESAAVISLASTGTTSAVCPNDNTGTATVVPSGGAGVGYRVAQRKKMPAGQEFAYSGFMPITASGFTFTSLRADTYEIILEDANGCSNLATPLEVVVSSLNPIIQIVPTVVNVSCHAGNDGSIVVNHPGFVATSYKWTGRNETTNTITGLIHASYEVEITYSGGCKEKFIFPITQPDVLNATSASTIACDKLNDGTITLDVTGGTTPYSFSLNNGSTWTTNVGTISRKIFANLSPGVYQPRIRDAKNCVKTLADITIRERGDDPRPRFLVATRQNALDELVLINTSYPTPTSTIWTLDPRATVISQSIEEARVKFPVAGNYSVTMNATFNGCSYVITKNLVISDFDPNDPGIIVGLRPITSATIVPNPTTGSFVLNVVLTKKQYTKIVILDAMGNIRYEANKNTDRTLGFSETINLPADLLSGLYILRVITDNDAQEIRFTLTR